MGCCHVLRTSRVSGGALAVTNDTKGAHNIAPVLKELAVSLGVT